MHVPHAPVRSLDLPVPTQRDARAHGQVQALILELELGTERASAGSRAPVLRPVARSHGHKTRVAPGVVAVARAHPEPHPSLVTPLQQCERLAVQRFTDAVGHDPRLAQERRDRGRDHGRRLVTNRGVREEPDVRGTGGVGRNAPQRRQGVAAGGAAVQTLGLDRHLEYAEPQVGHPLARYVRDVTLEPIGHSAAASRRARLKPRLGTYR